MTMSVPKLTQKAVEDAIGPIEDYSHQCHGAALALVRSGLLPKGPKWPWANP